MKRLESDRTERVRRHLCERAIAAWRTSERVLPEPDRGRLAPNFRLRQLSSAIAARVRVQWRSTPFEGLN